MSLRPERHRELFVKFAQMELDTGGPDPHMAIVGSAPAEYDMPLLLGFYVARYNVASAVALYHGAWQTSQWWENHKAGLPIRRERRAVYSQRNMIACLNGITEWVQVEWPKVQQAKNYEEAWKLVSRIPFFGRYAMIKYLEGLRRYAGFPHAMPDIRSGGAWSPILTLQLLGYEFDETKRASVNDAAAGWLYLVNEGLVGHELDYFRYETLLCNYRQALEGKYPGRPHDSELKLWLEAQAHWGHQLERWFDFATTRHTLFDERLLGELRGWTGPRKELEDTIVKHGYFWSDLLYDYTHTTDLSQPVAW